VEPHEQQFVLEQLAASEARLILLVHGLTPAQWHFHESPDRWSIAEIIEHLVVFERFILDAVKRSLSASPEPDKKSIVATREHLVLELADTRHIRFNAREAARPAGRWPDIAQLLREFHDTRAHTVAFVRETQAPLRDHFFPHIAFGDLDCYQWLVLLSRHGLRHALQIEEIKSHPGYPAAD
jgi:DinB superfamily